MLSDALNSISATVGIATKEPFSFQWSAATPGHLLEAVYDLQRAANWQDFHKALAGWTVPGQNFVYADRAGNIGYSDHGGFPDTQERQRQRACARLDGRIWLDRLCAV